MRSKLVKGFRPLGLKPPWSLWDIFRTPADIVGAGTVLIDEMTSVSFVNPRPSVHQVCEDRRYALASSSMAQIQPYRPARVSYRDFVGAIGFPQDR